MPGTVLLLAVLLHLVLPSVHGATRHGSSASRLEIRMAGGTLVWQRGARPVLRVHPKRGDGWYHLARRYCGDPHLARRLNAANPSLQAPQRDRPVDVPVDLLRADLRLEAVRALFPADERVRLGWQHWVLAPFGERSEDWKLIAALFTGSERREKALRRANPELGRRAPRRGRPVLVPESLLLPVFRKLPVRAPTPTRTPHIAASPSPSPSPRSTPRTVPTPVPSPTARPPRSTSGGGKPPGQWNAAGAVLHYGKDEKGEYAIYRLKRGEALYSAVVVRFTGQLHAADVNATAKQIARRSGIDDVSAIPIGYPVKIPLELLLPRYLPPGDPRREAWEKDRERLEQFAQTVHAADLSGVHVIIDAGHGGVDSGATWKGVWESVYAYDLLCRIKTDLERHTRATVWPTILDRSRGYTVVNQNVLKADRDQILLTHPRYALGSPVLGVHLRWYLTNDVVLRLRKKGVSASRIVFISLHADSLHPSVRGAMAYVPSRHLRPSSYRARTRGLSRYREYRDHPTVRLGRSFVTRSEASSRRLAGILVATLREESLEVHPYSPIRGSVLRGKRRWVPAVLRYTLAQNAVLVECCNLANEEDRNLLLTTTWRERFARAIVKGIAKTFGNTDGK